MSSNGSISVVPPRQPRSTQERADGWRNALTGIGDVTRDKRTHGGFVCDDFSSDELDELCEGDDMAARIVETLPEDMLRQGWHVKIEGDPAAEELVMARVDELGFDDKLQEVLEDARRLGGAGLLLGTVDNARTMGEPLDEKRLQDIGWLTALPRSELQAMSWYGRATEPKYGSPAVYRIREEKFSSQIWTTPSLRAADMPLVHESRMLTFRGVRLPRRRMKQTDGWGGSHLVRCFQVLRDFQQSWAGAGLLLQDFAQAVMKLKGLAEMMETGNEEVLVKRAQLIDLSRSLARAVLIDEDEEFERKSTSLTGFPELLQQFAIRLSAAARMPVTKLMGQSPAGLNATGDSDIRFWYDHVKSQQRKLALPAINRFLQLLFRAKNGPTRGKEPENWTVVFNPLWQLSDLEKADLKVKISTADKNWIDAQVVTPSEVAISHFSGDEFNPEISIDAGARSGLVDGQLAATDPQNTPPPPPAPAANGQQQPPGAAAAA